MKRFAISLMMSFALVSVGCEEEPDVNTVPPDDEPAVSGYRGELEDDNELDVEPGIGVEEPADTGILDPDPYSEPTLNGTVDEPTLGQPDRTQQPDQTEGVEDEPAVEEVPAQSLPEDAQTPEQENQDGSGSGS